MSENLPIWLIYLAVASLTVAICYSFVQRQKHGNDVRYDRIENIGVAVASVCMVAAVLVSVV